MEGITISFLYLVVTAILSFSVVLILTTPWINFLKEKYIGQYIREDGPQEHHSKKGTPTMGGVMMLAGIVAASGFVLLLLSPDNLSSIVLLVCLIGFALTGFGDDYLKVIKKHNKGITGWTKLFFQFLFAGVVVGYMFFYKDVSTVSIFGLCKIPLSYLYIPFALFVIVGSSNAINLTDGLDGLAASTSAIAFITLGFFIWKLGNYQHAVIAIAIAGSCLGFLVFNRNPAKIFMGDVGSLMLGGAFGALGVLNGLEFWLIPIGFIFVVEALSVIIQVISYQTTKKRIFKMSPLHHHFELCGNKETTVVLKFFIAELIACGLSVCLGYMWLFR